jgi:serine/threonine-protein kinase RsbW
MDDADRHNEEIYETRVIDSDLKQAEEPKREILDEVRRCRFRDDETFAIKLALEEVLCNAVKHGNKNDASKRVTIRFAVTPGCCEIIVRDEGPGFVPDAVPDPTSPDRLPLPNGRGIMLLRAYMDEVEYRDNGREVYFMKRSSGGPG